LDCLNKMRETKIPPHKLLICIRNDLNNIKDTLNDIRIEDKLIEKMFMVSDKGKATLDLINDKELKPEIILGRIKH